MISIIAAKGILESYLRLCVGMCRAHIASSVFLSLTPVP
jgi:hypothetical protein